MDKKITITIAALLAILFGLYFYNSTQAPAENVENETESDTEPTEGAAVQGAEHEVVFSGSAFAPRELSVKKGDTVIWTNAGSRDIWPASAIHPTHGVYPGSGIGKCGTAGEIGIFDACRGIAPGSSWSFTFNEAGEWRYHDHLRSNMTGTVTVSE